MNKVQWLKNESYRYRHSEKEQKERKRSYRCVRKIIKDILEEN